MLCALLSVLSNRTRGFHIALASFFELLLSDIFIGRFCCSDSFVQLMPRPSPSVFIKRVSQSLLKLLPVDAHSRLKLHCFGICDFGVSAVSLFASVLGYEGGPLNSILVNFEAVFEVFERISLFMYGHHAWMTISVIPQIIDSDAIRY